MKLKVEVEIPDYVAEQIIEGVFMNCDIDQSIGYWARPIHVDVNGVRGYTEFEDGDRVENPKQFTMD